MWNYSIISYNKIQFEEILLRAFGGRRPGLLMPDMKMFPMLPNRGSKFIHYLLTEEIFSSICNNTHCSTTAHYNIQIGEIIFIRILSKKSLPVAVKILLIFSKTVLVIHRFLTEGFSNSICNYSTIFCCKIQAEELIFWERWEIRLSCARIWNFF